MKHKKKVVIKILVMIGAHQEAIAWLMFSIVFNLLGKPTMSLEVSPLCFSLACLRIASNTTSTYNFHLRLRLWDDIAVLSAIMPTDNTPFLS